MNQEPHLILQINIGGDLTLHREKFDEIVKQKTVEFTKTNQRLQKEINEHIKINKLLKKSLLDKEILLKEIHHRVKNNLQIISSLIRLRSNSSKNLEIKNIYNSIEGRISAIALIHEKLYDSEEDSAINFGDYINDLIYNIFNSYDIENNRVQFIKKFDRIDMNIDTVIPCGLIINELVSNCLKHAFPKGKGGKIKISLTRINEKNIQMIVEDNGVGLPSDFDLTNLNSLGLQLVKNLVETQLQGQIDIFRRNGTKFRIRLKEL